MAQQTANDLSLQKQAHLLEQYLIIKDRKYNTKTYRNCFEGNDAVVKIITLKFASNQNEAVAFGNKLHSAKLIEHVEKAHDFKNKALFYQFTATYYCNINHSKMTLKEKARILECNLSIKNRRYKVSVYNNCFIGSEAIQKIIQLKFAVNIKEAIAFGNELIDANIFHHVEKQHKMENKELFYRFSDSYYREKTRCDFFEFVGNKTKQKHDNQCVSNSTSSQQSAYGSFVADLSLNSKDLEICHLWTLHIDKMEKDSSIAVGIDSVINLDSAFYENKSHNIAFRCDGSVFFNGMPKDVTDSFTSGDTIRIELNAKKRVIDFYRNHEVMKFEHMKMAPDKYRLAVHLLSGAVVTIKDYRTMKLIRNGSVSAAKVGKKRLTGNLFKDAVIAAAEEYLLDEKQNEDTIALGNVDKKDKSEVGVIANFEANEISKTVDALNGDVDVLHVYKEFGKQRNLSITYTNQNKLLGASDFEPSVTVQTKANKNGASKGITPTGDDYDGSDFEFVETLPDYDD